MSRVYYDVPDPPCYSCWDWSMRCDDCINREAAKVECARHQYIVACRERQQVSIEMERIMNPKLELIDRIVRQGQEYLEEIRRSHPNPPDSVLVPLPIPTGIHSTYPEMAKTLSELIQPYENQINAANQKVSESEAGFRSSIVVFNVWVKSMPSGNRKELGVKEKDPEEEIKRITEEIALTKPPIEIILDETTKKILSFGNQQSPPQPVAKELRASSGE